MLEKKAKEHHEAAAAREADMNMERERQRAIIAAQVLCLPDLGFSHKPQRYMMSGYLQMISFRAQRACK